MSILKKLQTDKDLEAKNGVRIELENGEYVVLHRAGGANRKYAAVLEAKVKPVRFQIQHDTLPQEKNVQLLAEVYQQTVIIGWNIRDKDTGEFMDATPENIVKTLVENEEFFSFIQREANNIANFQKAQLEADVKN